VYLAGNFVVPVAENLTDEQPSCVGRALDPVPWATCGRREDLERAVGGSVEFFETHKSGRATAAGLGGNPGVDLHIAAPR